MAKKSKEEANVDPAETSLPASALADGPLGGPVAPSWAQPKKGQGNGSYLAGNDPAFAAQYPVVHDFLTLAGIGGKARKVGTITLFAEDGKWKINVQDRDGGNYAFYTADSVQEALEGLNRALQTGSLDWRVSKWAKK